MLNRTCSVLAIPCLVVNLFCCDLSFAKDDELKAEELVAEHLKSIGSPEALALIKTRSISGNSTFKFISGATGQMSGPAQFVSEDGKMGIVIRYGGTEYPGEHFACDGKDVMVDNIKTGQRSPLGEFFYGHGGIMKSELWGGTLYVGWPLLHIKDSGARIKSKKKSIDGRELYELEYVPKQSMEDVKVKLYFDSATFRHVMTEYRLRLLLQDNTTIYVLTERFDDFRQIENLTLPFKYSINFMFEGSSGSLQTLYTFDIEKIAHNGNIDPRFYVAQK
jgi:hypothetical protein